MIKLRKKIIFPLLLPIILINISTFGQEEEKPYELNGYLSLMPQIMWNSDTSYKQIQVHNRVNFFWYPSEKLTFSAQMRTLLYYGNFNERKELSTSIVSEEGYFLPLTFQQTIPDNGFLSVSLDRLYMEYNLEKLDIKIGRQRINWGQTFVWNPNDIFNTYNFFDFDYAERAGADAIRLQYYTGATSYFDLAIKIDSSSNATAAALYKFNKWNCDFQFLSGYYGQKNTNPLSNKGNVADWITGFGFTGDYKGISLRTESSYLHPAENFADTSGIFLSSIGLDYTFKNDLSLNAEFLYMNKTSLGSVSGLLDIYSAPMTIKSIVFTKYNYFAQAAYPITPLLRTTFSGMVFNDKRITGYYIGPSAEVSLTDNISISAFYQFFSFTIKDLPFIGNYNQKLNFLFLRLKWNF